MEVFFQFVGALLFHEEIYQKMHKPFSQSFQQTQKHPPNTDNKVRAFLEPRFVGKEVFLYSAP